MMNVESRSESTRRVAPTWNVQCRSKQQTTLRFQ